MTTVGVDASARSEVVPPAPAVAGRTTSIAFVAQSAAMLLALVVWARVVTIGAGGRDEHALFFGCLSLLPAVLLLRPSPRALAPLGLLVVAALGVCWWAPYAFTEGQTVAVAAYGGAAFAVVRVFAATSERRRVIACALALVSLDQFARGFVAWWGGEEVYRAMVGTFYWHNQFAAFMLPGVLLGGALAIYGHRIERVIGFVCAPVCAAGLVYSASRAAMGAALLGLLLLAASCLLAADRGVRLRSAGLLASACIAVIYLFASPLFFGHWSDPFGSAPVRAQQELSTSTSARIDFWKAALAETGERPLVGGGFGSYGERSTVHLPPGGERSRSAHNEVLQAFAEGGVLWGLPVAGCVLGLAVGVLRRLRSLRPMGPDHAVLVGGSLSLGALVLHAGVDFDWSYPSLVVCAATVGGLVLAVPRRNATARPPARWRGLPAVAAAVLALALGAQLAHANDLTTTAVREVDTVAAARGPAAAASSVVATRSWTYDPRIDTALLRVATRGGVGAPLTLPAGELEAAVRRLATLAALDDDLNAQRAAVVFGLGRRDEALAAVRRMALQRVHFRPATLESYATLLALVGSHDAARDLLAGTVVLRAADPDNANIGIQLLVLYLALEKLAPGSRELRCAGSALRTIELHLAPDAPILAKATPADSCASLREKGWA